VRKQLIIPKDLELVRGLWTTIGARWSYHPDVCCDMGNSKSGLMKSSSPPWMYGVSLGSGVHNPCDRSCIKFCIRSRSSSNPSIHRGAVAGKESGPSLARLGEDGHDLFALEGDLFD
jgi:hypothetical protein